MRRPTRRFTTTAILLATLPTLAGCYSRVVDASGPNADAYDLYEPNNPNQKATPREKRTYRIPNQTQPKLQ